MKINRRVFIARSTAAANLAATGFGAMRTSLPPLVFIHGIKGSVLKDAQGSVRWFTAWQALGLATPDLSLPLHWQNDGQQRDGLVATVPLDAVALHDVYAPFLKWAMASGRSFHAFAYDWRRDNLETVDAFVRFLDKISRGNGGSKIQTVAHSMGGLITLAAVHRRPELFHSIIFAGVPFGGSVSFLEDLHSGTSNGFNARILNPQVLFTFPSVYCLLPPTAADSGLVEANGNPITHNWFSAADWERQRFGIFAVGGSNAVSPDQRVHIHAALDHARRFRSGLAFTSAFAYPRIAVLAGDTQPTQSKVKHNGQRSVKGWDFANGAKTTGDNRVEFANALPPAGVRYSLFKSSRSHEDLLSDTGQVESILTQLSR